MRSHNPARSSTIQRELATLAERVVDAVDPLQLILFGSRARGDTHQRSDVDLLVVLPEGGDRRQAENAAYRALRGSPMAYDLIVATLDEVRRYGNLVGTVYRPALREGRVLYDASAERPWQPIRAVTLEVEPVTEEERLATTEEWLERAREELRLAGAGLTPEHLALGPACYMAQQAAEKALKAVLVFLQIDYPMAHDLDDVRNTIPAGWNLKAEHPTLKWLSDWAIKGRYPRRRETVTGEDAEAAVSQARAVLESVLRDLMDHGYVPQ